VEVGDLDLEEVPEELVTLAKLAVERKVLHHLLKKEMARVMGEAERGKFEDEAEDLEDDEAGGGGRRKRTKCVSGGGCVPKKWGKNDYFTNWGGVSICPRHKVGVKMWILNGRVFSPRRLAAPAGDVISRRIECGIKHSCNSEVAVAIQPICSKIDFLGNLYDLTL
jgi:hypothetical protein